MKEVDPDNITKRDNEEKYCFLLNFTCKAIEKRNILKGKAFYTLAKHLAG